MSEQFENVGIHFKGEKGEEYYTGRINYESQVFQIFDKKTAECIGIIPFSAIRKLTIMSEQNVEKQAVTDAYDVSVVSE